MRIQTASMQHYSLGLWIVALVLVAAAGLAIGRWVVPADGTTTSVTSQPAEAPLLEAPAAAGHVIGMTFERPAFSGLAADTGVAVPPSSAGEGHVIGMTFGQPAFSGLAADTGVPVASDSPGEGHVIGMTFGEPALPVAAADPDSSGAGHVIGMTFR